MKPAGAQGNPRASKSRHVTIQTNAGRGLVPAAANSEGCPASEQTVPGVLGPNPHRPRRLSPAADAAQKLGDLIKRIAQEGTTHTADHGSVDRCCSLLAVDSNALWVA